MTNETIPPKPRVEIHYCIKCRWLLRAAWIAQELLMTFSEELGGVSLVPAGNGIYEVLVDDKIVFSRAKTGRFPEAKELKQSIRDIIAPDKDLRHSDAP